jgi:tetratricopeptide (TPR) repeat protein
MLVGENLLLFIALLALLVVLLFVLRRSKRRSSGGRIPEGKAMPSASGRVTPARTGTTGRRSEAEAPSDISHAPTKSSSSSKEVADDDSLSEAAVYLEFGYFDQAAKSLRNYVEKQGKSNLDVLRKLLQIYLQLKRIDDYADILEYMFLAGEDRANIHKALLAGLECDLDNLRLRVLAEGALGLGPGQLAEVLGSDVQQESDRRAGHEQEVEAVPVAADGAARSAPGGAAESGTAGCDPSPRLVLRLVEGGARLTSAFSMEEKAMLRVFTHPAHEARLLRSEARMHGAAGNLDAAADALRRAVAVYPRALVNFADLLWILHRQGRLNEYAHTLWHLYAVLDGAGRALRERFLGMGLALGQHDILEALVQSTDHRQIEEIGQRFNLLPTDGQERRLKLVETVEKGVLDISLAGHAGDVLEEVNSLLEFGQVDQAIEVIEAAILDNPSDPQLYPTLLDLYDRMGDLDRLTVLTGKLKKLIQRPPEEVAPMMLSLQQRLQQKKQGGRYARKYR